MKLIIFLIIVFVCSMFNELQSQTIFGVAQGGETKTVAQIEKSFELLKDLSDCPFRIDHVIDFFFQNNQKTDSTKKFAKIDSLVDMVKRYKLYPIFSLSYSPSLTKKGNQQFSQSEADNFVNEAIECATRIVEDLQGDSVAFEIWNEPNEKFFWNGTAKDYAEMFTKIYLSVKKFGKTVKCGGPAISGLQPYKLRWFKEFVHDIVAKSIIPDFISFHFYSIGYNNDPQNIIKGVNELNQICEENFHQKLPLYLTEWNNSWKPTDDENSQLDGRINLLNAIKETNIAVATYFELRQLGEKTRGIGLVNREGAISPFWSIYKNNILQNNK